MDSDLAKINVQQARVVLAQNTLQCTQFSVRNLPWCITQLPEPKATQEMRCRLGIHMNLVKRVASSLFALLRDHHRNTSLQACDLPINMQHLRFEKCRAITSDDRA